MSWFLYLVIGGFALFMVALAYASMLSNAEDARQRRLGARQPEAKTGSSVRSTPNR